jgi:antitoxin YefM
MTTMTATAASKSFAKIVRNTNLTHEPVRVTSESGSAVILSEEDYESLLETIELLEIPGFRESIVKSEREYASRKIKTFEDIFGE